MVRVHPVVVVDVDPDVCVDLVGDGEEGSTVVHDGDGDEIGSSHDLAHRLGIDRGVERSSVDEDRDAIAVCVHEIDMARRARRIRLTVEPDTRCCKPISDVGSHRIVPDERPQVNLCIERAEIEGLAGARSTEGGVAS